MTTTPAKQLSPETWGDRLRRATAAASLRSVVDFIHHNAGVIVGTRNTFAKLYAYENVPTADDPKDTLRAWLLLVTLGYDVADWGLDDSTALPAAWDPDRLRDLLFNRFGWTSTTAELAA